jgi:AraC-like DNA-binding protein
MTEERSNNYRHVLPLQIHICGRTVVNKPRGAGRKLIIVPTNTIILMNTLDPFLLWRAFNTSPGAIAMIRLVIGSQMNIALTALSEAYNFSSPSYFSRYVQKYLGVKPTDFRE